MPDELTVTLPQADWAMISAGLNELPYKHAAPVLLRLHQAIAAAQRQNALDHSMLPIGRDPDSERNAPNTPPPEPNGSGAVP